MILNFIYQKHGIRFKYPRLLKYANYQGYFLNINDIKYNDFIGNGKNNLVRLGCEIKTRTKYLKREWLESVNDIINGVMKSDINDSLMFHKKIGMDKFVNKTIINYFVYIGLIYEEGTTLIHKPTISAKKTIYKINKDFKQDYILTGDNYAETAEISYNGRSFQIDWKRVSDFRDWSIN